MVQYQMHPDIRIHKDSKQPKAIRAYWLAKDAAINEYRGDANMLHNADATYLLDTGRITEDEHTKLINHPDGNTMAQTHLRCNAARHEDGDQTLWSNPPKTWIKET